MTPHEQAVKELAAKYAAEPYCIPPQLAVFRAEQDLAARKRVAASIAKTAHQRNTGFVEIRVAADPPRPSLRRVQRQVL